MPSDRPTSPSTRLYPPPLVDFSVNLNPRGAPRIVSESAALLVDEIARYPDYLALTAREALGTFSRISTDQILLSVGATEALFSIPDLADPGPALIIQPSFWEIALQLKRATAISH